MYQLLQLSQKSQFDEDCSSSTLQARHDKEHNKLEYLRTVGLFYRM